MSRYWAWWALLGANLLSACASDGEASYEEGVRDICQGACIGYLRCGLSGSGCQANCVAEYEPRGIRGEALSVVGECLKTEDCNTLGSDEAFKPCFDQARATEPLRDELIAYCEGSAKAYFDCNSWWSVEECTHTMGLWSDDVLSAASQCFGHQCDELASCESGVFENPP